MRTFVTTIEKKVKTLNETIKDGKIRRFLLEAGFCWTLENYYKIFEKLITSKDWIKINWNVYRLTLTYSEEDFLAHKLSLIKNWKSIANVKKSKWIWFIWFGFISNS